MESASQIARAVAGDRAAREQLLERQLDKLRLYVGYRLGPALRRRVEVDDIVQEACLRAWRDLDGREFAGENSFFGFLAAIARRVIVDVARAARVRKRDGSQLEHSDWSRAGVDGLAASATGPLTRMARSEARQRLAVAFEGLAPQHRRILTLRQFEQRSARDAAASMGITEQAAHALYRRALDAWARATDLLDGAPDASR